MHTFGSQNERLHHTIKDIFCKHIKYVDRILFIIKNHEWFLYKKGKPDDGFFFMVWWIH